MNNKNQLNTYNRRIAPQLVQFETDMGVSTNKYKLNISNNSK